MNDPVGGIKTPFSRRKDSATALKPKVLFSKNESESEFSDPSSASELERERTRYNSESEFEEVRLKNVPLSFGVYHEKWHPLNDNEVVRDAAVSGFHFFFFNFCFFFFLCESLFPIKQEMCPLL